MNFVRILCLIIIAKTVNCISVTECTKKLDQCARNKRKLTSEAISASCNTFHNKCDEYFKCVQKKFYVLILECTPKINTDCMILLIKNFAKIDACFKKEIQRVYPGCKITNNSETVTNIRKIRTLCKTRGKSLDAKAKKSNVVKSEKSKDNESEDNESDDNESEDDESEEDDENDE